MVPVRQQQHRAGLGGGPAGGRSGCEVDGGFAGGRLHAGVQLQRARLKAGAVGLGLQRARRLAPMLPNTGPSPLLAIKPFKVAAQRLAGQRIARAPPPAPPVQPARAVEHSQHPAAPWPAAHPAGCPPHHARVGTGAGESSNTATRPPARRAAAPTLTPAWPTNSKARLRPDCAGQSQHQRLAQLDQHLPPAPPELQGRPTGSQRPAPPARNHGWPVGRWLPETSPVSNHCRPSAGSWPRPPVPARARQNPSLARVVISASSWASQAAFAAGARGPGAPGPAASARRTHPPARHCAAPTVRLSPASLHRSHPTGWRRRRDPVPLYATDFCPPVAALLHPAQQQRDSGTQT